MNRGPLEAGLERQLAVSRLAREAGRTSTWRLDLDQPDGKIETDGILGRLLGLGAGELESLGARQAINRTRSGN